MSTTWRGLWRFFRRDVCGEWRLIVATLGVIGLVSGLVVIFASAVLEKPVRLSDIKAQLDRIEARCSPTKQ